MVTDILRFCVLCANPATQCCDDQRYFHTTSILLILHAPYPTYILCGISLLSLLFHLPLMLRLLLGELSEDLHTYLLCQWLDVRSLVTLDTAVSSGTSRPYWATLLRSLRCPSINNMDHSTSSLLWLIQRRICASRMQMKVNAWRVPGCDLSLLKTVDLLHLGLNSCSCVTDECLMKLFVSSGRERSGGLSRR